MKTIARLLIAILTLNVNGLCGQTDSPLASEQTQTNQAVRATKAKADVEKRGVGERSRVQVTLHDGTQIKGYISAIDESSFAVTDKKSGNVSTIAYRDVNGVKSRGLSRATKILIVTGVVAGTVVGLAVLACHSEGGPHC